MPAALLSAITPLVVKLQLGDLRRTGQVVGRLSSIGTLGGITATLATGFVLVAALPTSVIMLGLAGLLGVAGFALGGLPGRRTGPGLPGPARTGPCWRSLGAGRRGPAAVAPDPVRRRDRLPLRPVEADPERPTGRTLLLNSAQHSYVDLADPTHLEFAYTQWIGAVADAGRRPGRWTRCTSAAAASPCRATWPRPGPAPTTVVLEIDGGLVDLDRPELRRADRARAAASDRRRPVLLGRQPAASGDLVIGDAFGHLVVPVAPRHPRAGRRRPPGAAPGRGLRAQRHRLSAGAVHPGRARHHRSRVRSRGAGRPAAALPGEHGVNFVIFASDAPLRLDRLAPPSPPSQRHLPLLSGADLSDFVGDALVLTDDYAPVDQLLATA